VRQAALKQRLKKQAEDAAAEKRQAELDAALEDSKQRGYEGWKARKATVDLATKVRCP
jgi:hypothetical protein